MRSDAVSVPLRGNRRESSTTVATVRNNLYLFPSPCGVIGVKENLATSFCFYYFLYVSVPLRGNRRERLHIFEACPVKLSIGSISIGLLYSQKACQIRNKTTNIKAETHTESATSRGQRNNAVFKVLATYGGDSKNYNG